MDTKENDLAETLGGLIHTWCCLDNEENKNIEFNEIVKFICQKYDEKANNVWLKQISENQRLLSKLFEKNEDGSFKCSKNIEVMIDDKKLNESDINDILGKIENKDLNLGYEFLLNKDEKHTKLLVELNEKIRKWKMFYNKLNKTEKDEEDVEKQIEDIAKFISNHYRTFVARLQQGVHKVLLNKLFARDEKTGLFKYKKAHKFLKEAADRGLIFAVASSGDTFLVDPNDENNKTLEIIAEKSGRGMWDIDDCYRGVNNIKVCAHPMGNFDKTFYNRICCGASRGTLVLIPLNDNFLSFISSRQTEGVENTCKIINYFTEKYFKQHNQRMNVTLEGASQGVDFITKMVGSTHGRGNTRIKNANIKLEIDSPHLCQNEEKIVKRLTNGAKNNNTITNISVKNSMGGCKHPKCKTDNLIEWLEYYQRHSNNKVEINDLRALGPNQQHTLN